MSASIHTPLKTDLYGHGSGSGGSGGGPTNTNTEDENNEKSSIIKYLRQCGLDTTDVDFSLDDVDDSSMALLIQLSQQSASANNTNAEGEGEGAEATRSSSSSSSSNVNDDNIKHSKDHSEKGRTKNQHPTNHSSGDEVRLNVNERVPVAVDSYKKLNNETGIDIISAAQTVEQTAETEKKETAASTTTTAGTGTGNSPSSSHIEEVTKIMNNIQKPQMENRDYEQLLAQYSLDANSFANSKMTKSSTTTTTSKSASTPLSQNENIVPLMKALFDKLEKQHEHLTACQDQIQSIARLIAQDMVERRHVMDLMIHNNSNNNNNKSGNMFMHDSRVDRQGPMVDTGMNMNHGFNANHPFPPRNHVDDVTEPPLQNRQQEQLPEQQQPQQQPQPQPQQQTALFTLLERFVKGLFHFPNAILTYIQSTFIVRVITLIKTEAQDFRQGGALRNGVFLNWTLLMKLIFFSFFLFARFETYDERLRHDLTSAAGSKKNRRELAELESWASHRTVGLLCLMIVIYFVQTGAWKFVHHILIKDNVLKRVWKNEDLENDGSAPNGNDNNNDNGSPLRRGRRDRHPINHLDGNENQANDNPNQGGGGLHHGVAAAAAAGINNDAEGLQERVRGRLRAVVEYIKQQTFLGGQIDRPVNRNNNNGNNNNQPQIPREQILLDRVIDSVKDVLYLFGSFFLSLFPMWHPRPREVVVVNDDNQNNIDVGVGGDEEPRND